MFLQLKIFYWDLDWNEACSYGWKTRMSLNLEKKKHFLSRFFRKIRTIMILMQQTKSTVFTSKLLDKCLFQIEILMEEFEPVMAEE